MFTLVHLADTFKVNSMHSRCNFLSVYAFIIRIKLIIPSMLERIVHWVWGKNANEKGRKGDANLIALYFRNTNPGCDKA